MLLLRHFNNLLLLEIVTSFLDLLNASGVVLGNLVVVNFLSQTLVIFWLVVGFLLVLRVSWLGLDLPIWFDAMSVGLSMSDNSVLRIKHVRVVIQS